MGILSGKMGFFYIITLIILAVLIIFYIKETKYNAFMQVAISLLFAGALGNFIIVYSMVKLLISLIQIFLDMIFQF